VPAVKEVKSSAGLVILLVVTTSKVESLRNCIAPKVPAGETEDEFIMADPPELNSNV
jgi:hypothetical protein